MNLKEISPAVAGGVIVALLLLAGLAYYMMTTPQTKPFDVTKATKADLEDASPPRPGQPGYRERITDTPLPGR